MHFCADDLTSGDMDEVQAIRKVHAELAELQKTLVADVREDLVAKRVARSRIRSLQHAVNVLNSKAVTEGILQSSQRIEAADSGSGSRNCEAYAVHTERQPLSMYSGTLWAMCFPHCFPYGDGVFALLRKCPLSFQQWSQMLLLREELVYEVQPSTIADAQVWFAKPANGEDQASDW